MDGTPGFLDMSKVVDRYLKYCRERQLPAFVPGTSNVDPQKDLSRFDVPDKYREFMIEPSQFASGLEDTPDGKRKRDHESSTSKTPKRSRLGQAYTPSPLATSTPLSYTQDAQRHGGQVPMAGTRISQINTGLPTPPLSRTPRSLSQPGLAPSQLAPNSQKRPVIQQPTPIIRQPTPAIRQPTPIIRQPTPVAPTNVEQPTNSPNPNPQLGQSDGSANGNSTATWGPLEFMAQHRRQQEEADARMRSSTSSPAPEPDTPKPPKTTNLAQKSDFAGDDEDDMEDLFGKMPAPGAQEDLFGESPVLKAQEPVTGSNGDDSTGYNLSEGPGGSVQDRLPETNQGPAQGLAIAAPSSAQTPGRGQGKTPGKSKAGERKRESMSETSVTEKPTGNSAFICPVPGCGKGFEDSRGLKAHTDCTHIGMLPQSASKEGNGQSQE